MDMFIGMSKLMSLKLVMALGAGFFSIQALADLHGTITGTTNYVWRSYSKSNYEPAIQANLEYTHESGFYMGTSISSFNIGESGFHIPGFEFKFDNPARLEATPYVGWSFEVANDWRLDAEYKHYFYDGNIYAINGDYNEYYLFLHFKDLISMMASYAQDFYGLQGDSSFYEITGRYPLTDYLQFSTTFGYGITNEVVSDDYMYWNAGLTASYKFLSFDLRYYDAREVKVRDNFEFIFHDHPDTLKKSIVFSISAGF